MRDRFREELSMVDLSTPAERGEAACRRMPTRSCVRIEPPDAIYLSEECPPGECERYESREAVARVNAYFAELASLGWVHASRVPR